MGSLPQWARTSVEVTITRDRRCSRLTVAESGRTERALENLPTSDQERSGAEIGTLHL